MVWVVALSKVSLLSRQGCAHAFQVLETRCLCTVACLFPVISEVLRYSAIVAGLMMRSEAITQFERANWRRRLELASDSDTSFLRRRLGDIFASAAREAATKCTAEAELAGCCAECGTDKRGKHTLPDSYMPAVRPCQNQGQELRRATGVSGASSAEEKHSQTP